MAGVVQMQVDYQWKPAEKTFQRAIELNPNWADTRECYALELTRQGRFDEGLREIERAESLEPSAWPLKAAHALLSANSIQPETAPWYYVTLAHLSRQG